MPDGSSASRAQESVSPSTYRPRVVIIGSGFGGSVTARRLAESGRFRVTLLERGHRYEPGDFPRLRVPDTLTCNEEWAYNGKLPSATRFLWRVDRGLWDLRNLGGLQTLQAAGFGGGSLVYASVHYRAPDVVFRTWPTHRCQHKACTACNGAPLDGALLHDHYTTVEAVLGVSTTKRSWPKTEAFERTAETLGRKATPVPLAIHFEGPPPKDKDPASRPCTGCGQCITGCNVGSKNTLDRTYLKAAEEAGLWVRTLSEATSVQALPPNDSKDTASADEPRPRYRVHYRNYFLAGRSEQVDADYVFVCAGAVSTTELLQHSVACGHLANSGGLTQLGKRFWANGDAFAAAFDTKEAWHPEQGPTITSSVGHVEPINPSAVKRGASLMESATAENDMYPDWFLLQNGGLPTNLVPALSLLTSPALLMGNAYSGDSSEPHEQPALWDWLSRAAAMNPSPDVLGLLSILPKDVRDIVSPKSSYREMVTGFLHTQLRLVREELTSSSSLRLARFLRRLILVAFADKPEVVDEMRRALGRQNGVGALFDAPHSIALIAHAVERHLLGPRPSPYTAILLAMGADAEWELTYQVGSARRVSAVTKDKERVNRLYRTEERLMRDFARAAGGQLRTNPAASVGQRPITVHSQGGCSMGNSPKISVVDPTGEVWGHPGLFVMDGAMMPSSVGVNPSHTIAAIAELNLAHFLERTQRISLDDEGLPPAPPAFESFPPKLPDSHYMAPVSDVLHSVNPSPPHPGLPVVEYLPIGTRPTTFSWDERMVGFLAPPVEFRPNVYDLHQQGRLEPDSYLEQYNRGVFAGYALELELSAWIADLDYFLARSTPRIEISGKANLRISNEPRLLTYDVKGELTLHFRTTSDPPLTQSPRSSRSGAFVLPTQPTMHYNLQLSPDAPTMAVEQDHQLAPRHLWGTKLLVDDPGFDAWQDLTTLYTDLVNKRHQVCLSGVVRVSLQDFLYHQLPSFSVDKNETTGLSSAQKVFALVRFVKRFLGDVSRLYDVGGIV